MRFHLPTICLSFAAALSIAGEVVTPYVTERELYAGEVKATDGALYASRGEDEAGNHVPYLVYSAPGETPSPVRDPYALHRRRVWCLEPPDWWAEPDPGVQVFPTNTYRLINGETAGTTRSMTIRPAAGLTILRVDWQITENRTADVTAPINTHATDTLNDDGSCTITAHVMDGAGGRGWLSVRIDRVYAERDIDPDFRDDLTLGDYYFRDVIGDTSLGELRRWVVRLTTNRLAQSWADYPASSPVRLNGRALWMDSTRTVYSIGATNTYRLYVGGTRVLDISAEAGANTNDFRIIGMTADAGGDAYTLYVPTGYVSYRAQTCTDIMYAEWTDCDSTQTTGTWTFPDDYPDQGLAGTTVPAVLITVQAGSSQTSRRFWRVIANDGEEASGTVFFPVKVAAQNGVLLKAPNGNWWRLKVANDGTISTEAADTPPNE